MGRPSKYNLKTKKEATELKIKGYSATYISKIMNIPISTLYPWLRKEKLTKIKRPNFGILRKGYQKLWREENREKLLEDKKQWYRQNREELKIKFRKKYKETINLPAEYTLHNKIGVFFKILSNSITFFD